MTFVDEIGFGRKPRQLGAANADVVLRFPLELPNSLVPKSASADTTIRCSAAARSKPCGWRRHFGGLEPTDVKRLRQLEHKNGRLKKLVAERDLELEIIKEATAASRRQEIDGEKRPSKQREEILTAAATKALAH